MSSTEVDSKKSESDYSASLHMLEALLPPLSKCFSFLDGLKKIWHMRNNCLLTKEAINYLLVSQKMRT